MFQSLLAKVRCQRAGPLHPDHGLRHLRPPRRIHSRIEKRI